MTPTAMGNKSIGNQGEKKGHIHEHEAYPIQNGGGGEDGKTYPSQDEKAKHKRNKKIQRRTEKSSCIPG